MKIRRIYHPTDFSEVSGHALELSARLARQTGAELHLVHVYDKPTVSDIFEGVMAELKSSSAEFEEKLDKKLSDQMDALATSDYLDGISVHKHLIKDVPVWKFTDELDVDKDADLITMGTTGSSSILQGGMLGSNTERTIRFAPIPVLGVPVKAELEKLDRMLFITDFTDPPELVFGNVLNYAETFNTEVVVGTISTPGDFVTSRFAREEFKKLHDKYPNVKFRHVMYNAPQLTEGVQELVDELPADVVALLAHGRSDLQMLYNKSSVVEELSSTLDCPLLALRPPDQEPAENTDDQPF